jgi:uncharacterized protein (TIGR02594 family)
MNLPKQYAFLAEEGAPRILVEFLKLYGTKEKLGAGSNPVIMSWAKEVGLDKVYTDDSIPWCGLGMAVVAHRAGKEIVAKPLWALSWANFGEPVDTPMLGDLLPFKRPGGGHIGIYVGEDATHYHVLGANQSDMINITRIAKERLHKGQARRPHYNNMPANVRVIRISGGGAVSKNEA